VNLVSVAAVLVAIWLAVREPPLAPNVPYCWGAYCACCVLLDAAGKVLYYFTKHGLEQPSAVIVIGVALCAVPAALGLLKRYRFGVWMLLAWAVVHLAESTIKDLRGRLWLAALAGFALSAVWMVPTASYFRKRWQYLA
jgi:hypothetical protein